ncbi:hypothetical protein GCM10011609_59370 [Lentzea pudingi]|uniref:Transposase n=1 Tax=Lentzea pudingi TaxID=1789439 RepID=A0ABQ2IHC2_9PSEU|nr:hypothetical protein GCM10011609_59370 [Lentzea pudingi]
MLFRQWAQILNRRTAKYPKVLQAKITQWIKIVQPVAGTKVKVCHAACLIGERLQAAATKFRSFKR